MYIYIYIYIYMCVCVCVGRHVCVSFFLWIVSNVLFVGYDQSLHVCYNPRLMLSRIEPGLH